MYSYLKPESVRAYPEATVRPWATCQVVGDALTFASALGYVYAQYVGITKWMLGLTTCAQPAIADIQAGLYLSTGKPCHSDVSAGKREWYEPSHLSLVNRILQCCCISV